MSRRASVFARQNPGKRRVRFPDEVIFENDVKEQDARSVIQMLRRASVDIDINRINSAGEEGVLRLSIYSHYCTLRIKKIYFEVVLFKKKYFLILELFYFNEVFAKNYFAPSKNGPHLKYFPSTTTTLRKSLLYYSIT